MSDKEASYSRDSDGHSGRSRDSSKGKGKANVPVLSQQYHYTMHAHTGSMTGAQNLVKNMDMDLDGVDLQASSSKIAERMLAKQIELHPDAPYDLNYDIAVIGNKGVGKTSMLAYEIENKSCHEQVIMSDDRHGDSHIVFRKCIYREHMMLTNNPYDWQSKPYIVRITYWDCSGDEKRMEEVVRLARHCAGVIYMFDITDRKSFDDLQEWIGLVEKQHMDLDMQQPRRRNSMVYDFRQQPGDPERKTFNTKMARQINRSGPHVDELGVTSRKLLLANKCDLRASDVIRVTEIRRLAKDYDLDYFVTSAETGKNIKSALRSLREDISDTLNRFSLKQIFTERHRLGSGVRIGEKLRQREEVFMLPKKKYPNPKSLGLSSSADWLES